MTDPVPNNNEQINDEEQVTNFGWWLCMLPFVVGAGVFTVLWWQHRVEAGAATQLLYALGVLVLGVIFAALVSGGDDKDKDKGATDSSGS
jgi:hypothetical protein